MLENINSDNICDSETFDLIFQVQDEVKRTELIIDLDTLYDLIKDDLVEKVEQW